MILRPVLCLFLTCSVFAQTKPRDLCVPPSGSVAPSLPAKLMQGQGTEHINFSMTTTNPKAQEFFTQGVAQMHSFWATEAERSFLQAAALDPLAPMPYWGIAMVANGDYRPRFQLEPKPRKKKVKAPTGALARALDAVKKAQQLVAINGKATDLERMYIAAVAARLDQSSKNPDAGYIQGLRKIVAAYPKEIEARSYLALHLMRGFELPLKTPREGSTEAVALLRQLLVDAPDHPGVHHYVIHGFEGSTFAQEAWPSCKKYSELVPNIPHALHMPGHIYSQTAKWDEAAKSFEDAAQNELGYIQADALYGRGHHGHNIHYLVQTYSFQERFEKAFQAAQDLLQIKENPKEAADMGVLFTPYRQGWFAMMRTLVQAEKWDAVLDGDTLPVSDKPKENAWRQWAVGIAKAAKGDKAGAEQQVEAMNVAFKQFKSKAKSGVPKELLVAREELQAHIALASNKLDSALQKLQSAARKERLLRYSEPTSYPRPILEVLGQIAFQHGNFSLAKTAFTQALEQYPGSPRAKRGLADAMARLEAKTQRAGL